MTPWKNRPSFLASMKPSASTWPSIDEISRQVLIMKYYLGMSYKEIGDALKMTPSMLKQGLCVPRKKYAN